jgi:hypothetical protein
MWSDCVPRDTWVIQVRSYGRIRPHKYYDTSSYVHTYLGRPRHSDSVLINHLYHKWSVLIRSGGPFPSWNASFPALQSRAPSYFPLAAWGLAN